MSTIIPPSARSVLMNHICRINSEIQLIKSIPTDSDKILVITDTLEELNKQLVIALNKYYYEIRK